MTDASGAAATVRRGAILTGGASRRMGRTKALIEIAGVPMAASVAAALRQAGCGEIVLIGGDAAELAPLGLPVIEDRHPGEGPLGGVLTALERAGPGDHVAVVACDLPRLRAEHIARLFDALHDAADVALARTDRRESACGVWRASAATELRDAFDAGERAVHRSADAMRVVDVDLGTDALHNVNSPDDLPP